MKRYFITFGDSVNYAKSLVRIEKELVGSNGFFDGGYSVLTEKSIPEFIDYHRSFIKANKRGYGYWIWKPYIIQQQLAKMDEGDILLYADCGCHLNFNDKATARLTAHFDKLKNSEFSTSSFEMPQHKEKSWTKGDVYKFLQANVDESAQLIGGIIFVKKCQASMDLFTRINKIVSEKRYKLFDDSPSYMKRNDRSFVEHRHDQSILSLTRKQAGTLIMPDETNHNCWPGATNWDDPQAQDYPVIAQGLRE